jgi:hypothetical protein
MDLKQLKAKGGIVTSVPVAKEVTWVHRDQETGDQVTDTFTVHILKQSFGSIERLFTNTSDRSRSAAFISECVRFGEGGKEAISYEEAFQLDPSLAAVLVVAANEVNGTGKAPAEKK